MNKPLAYHRIGVPDGESHFVVAGRALINANVCAALSLHRDLSGYLHLLTATAVWQFHATRY
jgi:hypothetical protein